MLASDRYAYSNNNPINYNDPSGHSVHIKCPPWFCNNAWLNFSGINQQLKNITEVVGSVGCFFLSCHVDSVNDTIKGPTTKEYAKMVVNNIPGPSMVTFPSASLSVKVFSGVGLKTEISANLIKQIASASTKGNRTQGGITILGSFPEYTNMDKLEGLTYFDMDGDVWNILKQKGDDYVWAIDKQFIDDSITAENKFIVTLGEGKPVGPMLERELQYIQDLGYRLVDGVFVTK